jgi:hypothetical protein
MTPGFFLSADAKDGELRASTKVLLNNHSHDKKNKQIKIKKNWPTKLRTLEYAGPLICSSVPLQVLWGTSTTL